jgi:hypothetical protein
MLDARQCICIASPGILEKGFYEWRLRVSRVVLSSLCALRNQAAEEREARAYFMAHGMTTLEDYRRRTAQPLHVLSLTRATS